MNPSDLYATVQNLLTPLKGILAADESVSTIGKRFKIFDISYTEANRHDYREMLFDTELAMKKHISGVILHDETIQQSASSEKVF